MLACAILEGDGRYRVEMPRPVGEVQYLFERLLALRKAPGAVLAGFDFPIGLPAGYASACGVQRFLEVLPHFGQDEWAEFYLPAARPEQIGLRRPFYPMKPGASRQAYLLQALGAANMDELRRRCERARPGRRAASSLFWTLGGQQVGKAAICGWRDLLAPALRGMPGSNSLQIWPFDGSLANLLAQDGVVAAETYPAEMYDHIEVQFGRNMSKRRQADRAVQADALLDWAKMVGVELEPAAETAIRDGFGPSSRGEDAFDAVVGLFGMLNILAGRRLPGDPQLPVLKDIEGWILGML